MSKEVVRENFSADAVRSLEAKARNGLIGAIVGDIAGSRFEFHNRKTKDFALLVSRAEVPERPRPKKGDKPRRLGEALLAAGSLLSSTLKDNAVQERNCYFTDDSVMTLAVADAILKWHEGGDGSYADVSCQGSVPQALEAFFESTSFEDAIRNAISIGGDSDTIGAICGAVAGAYYGVPDDIRAQAEAFLDDRLLKVLHDFESRNWDVSKTSKED